MAVVKNKKKKNNYLQIDKQAIEDNKLSWGATGLLTYLIGKPDNWEICIEQLKTAKVNGRDGTRKLLNELRAHNYCHYFEIRKKGVVKETIYLIFENPTSPETAKEEIEVLEDEEVYYKKIKVKNEEKYVVPKTEKPISAMPVPEKPTQLIIDSTNIIVTNNNTTTKALEKEKFRRNSSSYEFLDLEEFKLLNIKTKSNIRNNISELSKEKFEEIYNSVKAKYESNKIQNFNGFLYQALNENWDILSKTDLDTKKELGEDKKEWLRYFSGICSDKNLKAEIENIIADIPFEVLRKNKSKLSRLEIFDFKSALYQLKNQNLQL